jgi:glycosyltransferase involved in cell wall biosynthesis
MIRVAFLIRSLSYGGAERQLATLARALDQDGFDVTVITFYSGGHFERGLAESNVRLVKMRKRGRWEVVRFLWRVMRELKKLRPDILHSYLVEPNLVAVLLKPLFRSTKIVWGIRASNVELENYDWFTRMNFRIQRFMSRFPDLIIANSEAGLEYHLKHGFPAQKCIVIHGAVDLDRFRPDRKSGQLVRAAWGITDDSILIGLVARLDPIKDHPTFLKAAVLLSDDRNDVRFVCIGSGPEGYLAELRQLAEEYGIGNRVIWAGERDDMPAVYNALDIVCSSSVSEGLPNAIAEAMACDVPCVVTDVGDSAWLVGDTGIVVPPNDPQALADGLKECMSVLASQQRPDTRARIAENFSLAQLVNRTAAALATLEQASH